MEILFRRQMNFQVVGFQVQAGADQWSSKRAEAEAEAEAKGWNRKRK